MAEYGKPPKKNKKAKKRPTGVTDDLKAGFNAFNNWPNNKLSTIKI